MRDSYFFISFHELRPIALNDPFFCHWDQPRGSSSYKYLWGGLLARLFVQPATEVLFRCQTFFKWANPGFFFVYFQSFQTNNPFLQQINVKKCPSSIWHQDLNPQHLEHESSPITTRPGLHYLNSPLSVLLSHAKKAFLPSYRLNWKVK